MRARWNALLSLASALVVSGCATVSTKVQNEPSADLSYSTGRAIQEFSFPPGPVGDAIVEAMADLKMTVVRRARDGAVFRIDAKTEDNRGVLVTLRPHQGALRVSCRIGWFGDEPLSKALLERTGIRLGTLPPAAIPEKPPSQPASNPFFSRSAVPDADYLRDFADAPYRDRPIP
jgi:Protein of unknown function (DUF3568)